MSKRNTPREPIIVRRGSGWHITYDVQTKDYAAITDDAGLLGFFGLQIQAEDACREYVFENLKRAA